MRLLGEIGLLVSLVSTGYAAFLSIVPESDARRLRPRLALTIALAGQIALSTTVLVLACALVWRDFRFEYVAQYASRQLPWQYCLSALWVGQAGSLLLWAWMMGAMAILLRVWPSPDSGVRNTAFGLVMGNVCFLVAVMVFAADPMAANRLASEEGAGLSPLLQHPSMLIHPPIVFLAYSAWSVPCALALGALSLGRANKSWLGMARPWALAAWALLGAGLLIGAHWAYQELGWGGYWGWDPVENGSLVPWLTGTAFIHSMLAWRHRECLKKTTTALAIVTFGLCNFATFLTRSGIFSSVHAFSESPIGWMFLALMLALAASGATLLVRRRELLVGSPLPNSILARESLAFASILLLLLLTIVVVAGTLVAPLSRAFVGRMIQVGPEFYNNVLLPIALAILAMTTAVPLLQWGGPPPASERRVLALCFAFAAGGAAAATLAGWRDYLTASVAALAVLTATVAGLACVHDARRHNSHGFVYGWMAALRRGRRPYAAYTIHLGIACVAVGVTGSSAGTQRTELILSEGDAIQWAGRQVRYVRLEQSQLPDKLVAEAVLEIACDDGPPVTLRPARHLHLLQNEWTTEVAVHSSWSSDFYTVLHAGLGNGQISLTLVDNPMVRWIWTGGILTIVSAVVAALPSIRRRHTRQAGGRKESICTEWQPVTKVA